MARDEVKDGDERFEIGSLVFLVDMEMRRVIDENGTIAIGYQSSSWGGGFTVGFDRASASSCGCG